MKSQKRSFILFLFHILNHVTLTYSLILRLGPLIMTDIHHESASDSDERDENLDLMSGTSESQTLSVAGQTQVCLYLSALTKKKKQQKNSCLNQICHDLSILIFLFF